MSVSERNQAKPVQTAFLQMPPQLELQDVVCGGRHTLVLTGELDIASASALHAALAELCTDATSAVVLDLRKLTFMDSTGIKAVIVAKQLCAQHGCDFLVIPGHGQVLRVFAISGMLDQLPLQIDDRDVDTGQSRGGPHTENGTARTNRP